jgi:hypothetical protein
MVWNSDNLPDQASLRMSSIIFLSSIKNAQKRGWLSNQEVRIILGRPRKYVDGVNSNLLSYMMRIPSIFVKISREL